MTLKEAIISRDHCSEEDADDMIKLMRESVNEGNDPETVLEDEGFEPDYVFDLID